MSEQSSNSIGLPHSSAREFGHTRNGFAVEFNFAGFACRSLTVETLEEAQMICRAMESADGTSSVRVVVDS